jgi:tetratricopeptide (TPR) repeat protein
VRAVSAGEWVAIFSGVVLFLSALRWLLRPTAATPPPRLPDLTGVSSAEVALVLYRQYLHGQIHPAELERAQRLSAPRPEVLYTSLNYLICVEVAAGRYREALEWRARWPGESPDAHTAALVRINEAEALACLGRWEESLAMVEFESTNDFIRTGAAAHRAWVLAELGRIGAARAALREPRVSAGWLPPEYRAEFHFAGYAIAFAARALTEATVALDAAQSAILRESSRRNLDFYRGRIAFAQGDAAAAIAHFERGGQSRYRCQGGASLLEWGDALAQLGRGPEAGDKWQRCLSEDPQSPAARLAEGRLSAQG